MAKKWILVLVVLLVLAKSCDRIKQCKVCILTPGCLFAISGENGGICFREDDEGVLDGVMVRTIVDRFSSYRCAQMPDNHHPKRGEEMQRDEEFVARDDSSEKRGIPWDEKPEKSPVPKILVQPSASSFTPVATPSTDVPPKVRRDMEDDGDEGIAWTWEKILAIVSGLVLTVVGIYELVVKCKHCLCWMRKAVPEAKEAIELAVMHPRNGFNQLDEADGEPEESAS